MEHTDKKPFDDIDRGVVHHVREKGNHPQYKTMVYFAEGRRGERERERERDTA